MKRLGIGVMMAMMAALIYAEEGSKADKCLKEAIRAMATAPHVTTGICEAVMVEGMWIAFTNSHGEMKVTAGKGFERSYTWAGDTRSLLMWPRTMAIWALQQAVAQVNEQFLLYVENPWMKRQDLRTDLMLAHARIARLYESLGDPRSEGHVFAALRFGREAYPTEPMDRNRLFKILAAIDAGLKKEAANQVPDNGYFANDTYINVNLGFCLKLTDGWTFIPNTEIEREVSKEGSNPVERVLLTAVRKDDTGTAMILCLLSPSTPAQIFANTSLNFAPDKASGAVERVNINGLELLHRQDRWKRDGNEWRSDIFASERPYGTLAFIFNQEESMQFSPAEKIMREMLTTRIDLQPTHAGDGSTRTR